MKTAEEIAPLLAHYTGTEAYHRFSLLFRNVVLTDGAQALADHAGAYWLMDMIASHLPRVPKHEGFAVVRLVKAADGTAEFTLSDDLPVNELYADQHIEHTDFPFDKYKLYVARQDGLWIVMLPSEY